MGSEAIRQAPRWRFAPSTARVLRIKTALILHFEANVPVHARACWQAKQLAPRKDRG